MRTTIDTTPKQSRAGEFLSKTCRRVLVILGRFFASCIYRIRHDDLSSIPATGGALLVCNHLSYMDAAVIQCCIPRRIHFLMYRGYYEKWWMKPICRLLGVIPIAASDNPRALLTSLRAASNYIASGELVCVFPEGALSRNGTIGPFNRGLEVIMKRQNAPIVPLYLSGMWGTFLSYQDGKLLKRLPVSRRHRIILASALPLPARSTSYEVRDAVMELGADTEIANSDHTPLVARFIRQAKRHPFRFAMADSSGCRLQYGSACMAVLLLAQRLRQNVTNQRNIGILLPSSTGGALVNLAVNLLGRTGVNLNYSSGSDLVQQALSQCGIKTVITSRQFVCRLGWSLASDQLFIEDLLEERSWLETAWATLLYGIFPTQSILRRFSSLHTLIPAAPATILFSSGSTGNPKGVALSAANINANIDALNHVVRMGTDARIMGALPFFHAYGLTATLWYPLGAGLGVVYNANPFDFRTTGRLIRRFRATLLPTTPTFLRGYLAKCSQDDLASLQHVVVGAEKMPGDLADTFKESFGLRPREGYGCTELAPFACVNVPDYVDAKVQQSGTKEGTVGRPMPGVAVQIVDPESRQPVQPGEAGLLLIKGPNVMTGYWQDPGRTEETMHNGWYVTGDIASVDDEGFVSITDRLSRFSKIGGEMVPHERIENAILQTMAPSVQRVCAVTAVPDSRKGEKLVVLHAAEMDPGRIREALQKEGIPNLWIPKADAFIRVPQIPVLATGKLDLYNMRSLAIEAA